MKQIKSVDFLQYDHTGVVCWERVLLELCVKVLLTAQ